MLKNEKTPSTAIAPQDSPPTFEEQNGDLVKLPLDVLCSSGTINDALRKLEHADILLAEKMRIIEQQNLTPWLTGSRLSGDFRLHLRMSDDLSRLTVSRIDGRMSERELNGTLRIPEEWLVPLVEIPNPTLFFSARDILAHAKSPLEAEQAIQLFTVGRRITEYMGVPISWDQSVDKSVWTTNIDTVCFLAALKEDGVFERTDIQSSIELGVGGGAISKTLLEKLPNLEEHTITDITPYALVCAQRNIRPILGAHQRLNLYLGKGIKTINAAADLLLVNPPYIPHLKRPDAVDPYRGTGLIKEVIEVGLNRLNSSNPKACIYLGMSSLAQRDFDEYLAAHPEIKVERIGASHKVPLKILAVSENLEWLENLKREHGLVDSAELQEKTGFRFWHEIFVVKLSAA